MVGGLLSRTRAAYSTRRFDAKTGELVVEMREDLLSEIVEALDAADRVLPWVGVEQMRDRLAETLA